MRTVRNITVTVEHELYRQTRKIAADYDTTVTDMVRFLLLVLPEAAKSARYPGRRPQFSSATVPATPQPHPPAPSLPASPSPEKNEISPCTPVIPSNHVSLQQLAGNKSTSLQRQYLSTPAIKSLIQKALRAISQIAIFSPCTPVKSRCDKVAHSPMLPIRFASKMAE